MWVKPVTLDGETVRIEPLGMQHSDGLRALWTSYPDLLLWHGIKPADASDAAWDDYMYRSLNLPGRMPFAIVIKETGQPAGTSSFLEIRPEHRGLEIGGTWYGAPYQRTEAPTPTYQSGSASLRPVPTRASTIRSLLIRNETPPSR